MDARAGGSDEAGAHPAARPAGAPSDGAPPRGRRARAPEPPAASYPDALRRLRPALILAAVFSAAVNLLMLTGPIYMLQVYDRVLASGSVPTLKALFGIVVVLYGALGLYLFLRARLLGRAAFRLDAAMSELAFDRVTAARGPRAVAEAAAEEGSDPLRDLAALRGFLSSPAMSALYDLPWIPFFLAVVTLVHPLLGGLTTLGAGVVLLLALLSQRAGRRPLEVSAALEREEAGFVAAAAAEADTLRAMGMRGAARARWRALRAAAQGALQVGGDRGEGFAALSRSFRLLLQSMLLTLGAYLAIRQEISPGMIIAASIIAGRALAPVDQAIAAWPALGRARAAHRALKAAFPEVPPEGAPARGVRLPAPEGRLEVDALTCLSPEDDPATGRPRRLLDGVSFALGPGEAVGVIGPSASGKTSLARLLVGAWSPDTGEVRLGGVPLERWGAEGRARHVGYLPQRVAFLPGTVAENIARFDPMRTDEEIVEAARLVGVHEALARLPEGYATPLEEATLSGGQRQRVALARAVIGPPPLVVLDEPNANLDAEGDAALTRTLLALRERGCAVVVMAHRPGALAAVSKLLVLKDGRVLRFGDRDALMPALATAATGGAAATGGTAAASGAIPAAGRHDAAATGAAPASNAPPTAAAPLAAVAPPRPGTGRPPRAARRRDAS